MNRHIALFFHFGLIVAICSVFMLSGCFGSTAIPYVSSAPPEKLCTLNFAANCSIKNFDGQDVDWSANFGDNWGSVQIAEGKHSFLVDYFRAAPGGGWYESRGITVTFDNFKAGRSYRMMAAAGAEIPTSGDGYSRMVQMSQNMTGNRLQIRIVEVSQ